MKLMKLTLVTAGLGFAIACDNNTDGTDTPDTGDTFGDTAATDTDTDECGIEDDDDLSPAYAAPDEFDFTCTPGTTFNIVLRTINWGYDGEMYIADTTGNDYDEVHDLTETDQSVCVNDYSVFELNVTPKADEFAPGLNYENGERTTFRCIMQTEGRLSYAAVVYDEDGAVSDCVVFGANPSALTGAAPGTLTFPSWLDSSCRTVSFMD